MNLSFGVLIFEKSAKEDSEKITHLYIELKLTHISFRKVTSPFAKFHKNEKTTMQKIKPQDSYIVHLQSCNE